MEHKPDVGVLAMAAPLFDVHGEPVGALALMASAGPNLSRQRQQWPLLVREAAARISQAQGYHGNELLCDPVQEEQREHRREHA